MKIAKFFLILLVLNAMILGTLFLIGVITTDQAEYVGLRVSGVLGVLLIGSFLIGFLSGKSVKSKNDSSSQGPQF